MRLRGCEYERVLREVNVNLIILVRERILVTLIGRKHGQQCHGQLLRKLGTLVKDDSAFTVNQMLDGELGDELLKVLNSRAVEDMAVLDFTRLKEQTLAECLGEHGLTAALWGNKRLSGDDAPGLEDVGVEIERPLGCGLTYDFVEWINSGSGVLHSLILGEFYISVKI
jgi:hypothetical protein|tara:strand:+ start:2996 stop:3502 length:507 start_codon:yes stop_codon:yes gene_type:complete